MSLPPSIIVDLDGTLSSVEWRVPLIGDPPNWQRFNDALTCDAPNKQIAALVNVCSEHGIKVLLMTGRTERNRYITRFWLAEQGVKYDQLIMRPNHEFGTPADTKRALYTKHVWGKYEVLFALDDHDEVIDMWESLDIPAYLVVDPGHDPLYPAEGTGPYEHLLRTDN